MIYDEVRTLDEAVMTLVGKLVDCQDPEQVEELTNRLITTTEVRDEIKEQFYENICKARQNRILENDALDAEIKRLKARKALNDRGIEWYERTLNAAMEANNNEPFTAGTFKISYRKSSVCNINEELFADERFQTIVETRKIDKMGVKKAINDGENIIGAEVVTNYNLQVK